MYARLSASGRRSGIALGLRVEGRLIPIEANHRSAEFGQIAEVLFERHHRGRADLGELVSDSCLGVIGEQRDIGPARFENTEQADDHLGASLDAEADAGVGRNPVLAEEVGELVRPRVQLRVGEHAAGECQRGRSAAFGPPGPRRGR